MSSPSRMKTILKVKDHIQQKAQGELVKIQTAHEHEGKRLVQLEDRKETALGKASDTEKSKAKDLQAGRAFLHHLSGQINDQQKKVETIQTAEDSKRKELLEVTKSKKMIERLNEKQEIRAAKEAEKKNQRLIDMLAQRIRAKFK